MCEREFRIVDLHLITRSGVLQTFNHNAVARLEAGKAKVATLYARWEELEAIREAAGA